ncbi:MULTISPECIES: hypothetical protein [unclassified Mesorhizobium]|uniref:phosphoribosyltransferase-like protein n=1 Tax=unclassified Mesorhizobium TaxID=325217 RepID=UPI001125BBC9|nr:MULTISPECIES: hypothetical protein [unclassified Mesorhizobium]MBZ9696480.1 hypothetical protein [Mesorhizobium sp. CO1-1-9]TPK11640.1 hypothetical protein FJ543_19840 [Mesorhizobium sp. B2-5-7]
MRKDLAESLLAKIMEWSDEEKAAERAYLESFASYKYDEYQQFSPGKRFIESLALWLGQFTGGEERRAAYNFVRNRLLFISTDEMNHLVELTFPTIIRPILIADTATELGVDPHKVKAIVDTVEYRTRLRQTLVLGLSDGARTDWFRRANPQEMSNEQVFHAYDVSDPKSEGMVQDLRKHLAKILGREPHDHEARFRYIVLLDDFTGSGRSFIREDGKGGWTGKIAKIVGGLMKAGNLGDAIADSGVKIIIILYVAGDQAIEHIESRLPKLTFGKGTIEFEVVHKLGETTPLDDASDSPILGLVADDRYFDDDADDEHSKVGGTSKRYGFANCRLPLVLAHNTPNNSIYLLWAEDDQSVRGLFPRVSRHRKLQ